MLLQAAEEHRDAEPGRLASGRARTAVLEPLDLRDQRVGVLLTVLLDTDDARGEEDVPQLDGLRRRARREPQRLPQEETEAFNHLLLVLEAGGEDALEAAGHHGARGRVLAELLHEAVERARRDVGVVDVLEALCNRLRDKLLQNLVQARLLPREVDKLGKQILVRLKFQRLQRLLRHFLCCRVEGAQPQDGTSGEWVEASVHHAGVVLHLGKRRDHRGTYRHVLSEKHVGELREVLLRGYDVLARGEHRGLGRWALSGEREKRNAQGFEDLGDDALRKFRAKAQLLLEDQ
mmetsp:Transcript_86858/g.243350  ORF Transcript_86858/g.243350 Transcript_86858/m.243350 type:complete len:291 (+) Transcript_86858:1895-2767(+)